MNSKAQIKTIAVIGTGFMGAQHLEIWNALGVKLIVCSADQKGGATLAQKYAAPFYTDYTVMMDKEKPDAVSICLPTSLHYEAVKAALSRKISVLCEKPFTSETAEADELCRLARKKGVLMMIGHSLRFGKVYAYLKKCISDGRFGKLTQLNLYRHSTVPEWSAGGWLLNTALSGGALKDLHVHETDMVNYLFGLPESVSTVGSLLQCTTVYRYPGELGVCASAGWRSVRDLPFMSGYDATFAHAVLKCEGTSVRLYTDEGVRGVVLEEELPYFYQSNVSLENEITYFLTCLVNETEPEICMPESVVDTMRLSDAELQSQKLRREVSL